MCSTHGYFWTECYRFLKADLRLRYQLLQWWDVDDVQVELWCLTTLLTSYFKLQPCDSHHSLYQKSLQMLTSKQVSMLRVLRKKKRKHISVLCSYDIIGNLMDTHPKISIFNLLSSPYSVVCPSLHSSLSSLNTCISLLYSTDTSVNTSVQVASESNAASYNWHKWNL